MNSDMIDKDMLSDDDGAVLSDGNVVGDEDGDTGGGIGCDSRSDHDGSIGSSTSLTIDNIASGLGGEAATTLVNDQLEIEGMGTFVDEAI